MITPRAAVLIFSPFLLRLKLFDVTPRDVITIIRQKISDAEQAGVREVPLSNLRRLTDQIEQDISGDHAKTPHRTQSGNSRSKLNTDIGNFRSGPRNNVRRNNTVVHARRDLHRVVFLAAK